MIEGVCDSIQGGSFDAEAKQKVGANHGVKRRIRATANERVHILQWLTPLVRRDECEMNIRHRMNKGGIANDGAVEATVRMQCDVCE